MRINTIKNAVLLFGLELQELFKRPKELILFYMQYLLTFIIFIGPIYLFNKTNISLFIAAYIAGILNSLFIQQFSSKIIGKVENGEYEAFCLSPISHFSLYLANVFSFILLIPIFIIAYMIIAILNQHSSNLLFFVSSIVFMVIANAPFSIFLAGFHLGFRSLSRFIGMIGILIVLYSLFAVPLLYNIEPWNKIIFYLPWTHTSLLTINSFLPILSINQELLSIVYLICLSAVLLPFSLKFFKLAENRAKKNGFASDAVNIMK